MRGSVKAWLARSSAALKAVTNPYSCGHNAGAVCVLLFAIAEDGKKVRNTEEVTVPATQCGLPKTHSFWASGQ